MADVALGGRGGQASLIRGDLASCRKPSRAWLRGPVSAKNRRRRPRLKGTAPGFTSLLAHRVVSPRYVSSLFLLQTGAEKVSMNPCG